MGAVLKSLMKQGWFHAIVCKIVAAYLRVVYATSRWEIRNREAAEALVAEKSVLMIMWHNRIALPAAGWQLKKYPLAVLASGHQDGQLVTGSLSRLGLVGVSIPQKQAASGAVRQVIRLLADGYSVVMTPDGPRGPRYQIKEGVIQLARLSKRPVLLVGCSISRRVMLKSWDRFILPLPFAKGILDFAPAPDHPGEKDAAILENYRQNLERQLFALTEALDMELGFPRLEAANEADFSRAAKRTGP